MVNGSGLNQDDDVSRIDNPLYINTETSVRLPVLVEGDSRQQTEEQLRELRQQENALLDKIVHHEGTMKDLIIQIAQSMEKRFELLDPVFPADFSVSQISTNISRVLHQLGSPMWDLVRRYLPEKYKNTSMQRAFNTIDELSSVIEHCGHDVRKQLEQLSNLDIDSKAQFIAKAKNLNDDVGTILNNALLDLQQEGVRRGMGEIGGEKIRDQISERDFRYEIPDYFGLKELNEEVTLQGNREIKALDNFYNKKYPECPATERQSAWKYANVIRVRANLMETINEDKWSGDKTFWFDREFWKNIQSSHKSGNSTLFPTTLCARCSSNVAEDHKDFHRMKYWRPSPTGYICDNCQGTEYIKRFNSREQVGDKETDVYRDAIDIVNHMTDYPDVYLHWRDRFKNPGIYARKTAIAEEFEDSAFGKGKIVVPRKKVSK